MDTYEVQPVDLRAITMDADRCLTRVILFRKPLRDDRLEWLRMGRASLAPWHNDHMPGAWMLKARMGATDPYHDRAIAVQLPLVGVEFERVEDGNCWAHAYVDSSDHEFFHVPPPGYAPKTRRCTDPPCRSRKQRHLVVDEDDYMPGHDAALFEAVRGKLVEIHFYVLRADEED